MYEMHIGCWWMGLASNQKKISARSMQSCILQSGIHSRSATSSVLSVRMRLRTKSISFLVF